MHLFCFKIHQCLSPCEKYNRHWWPIGGDFKFKHFYFISLIWGRWIQFDEHIFSKWVGWNHQRWWRDITSLKLWQSHHPWRWVNLCRVKRWIPKRILLEINDINVVSEKKEGRWPAMIIVKEFWRHNKNIPFIVFFVFFGVAMFGYVFGLQGVNSPYIHFKWRGEVHPIDSRNTKHRSSLRSYLSVNSGLAIYVVGTEAGRWCRFNGWIPPKKMEVDERCFSVQVGWILGFMLIFRGVTKTFFFFWLLLHLFFSQVCFWINKWKSENDRSNKHD